jgi:WD40 repeat protein
LHRLKGHEGVIFSVKFSVDHSMICTTSDDRTARLWKVETPVPGTHDWQKSKIACHRVLSDFHTSRIFSAVFYVDSVVTVGEDSAFCRWSIEDVTKISWKRCFSKFVYLIDLLIISMFNLS